MNARAEVTTTPESSAETREKITPDVAEDHAHLLVIIRQCLAEIGISSSLTTFHNLVLRLEPYEPPSCYQPELDVLWPGERPGIALRAKLIDKDGKDFYAWGVSWAQTHPVSDPVGAVQVIADAVLAA